MAKKEAWSQKFYVSKSKKKKSGKWKTKFFGSILKNESKGFLVLVLDELPEPDKDGKYRLTVGKMKKR